jgi:ribokinase
VGGDLITAGGGKGANQAIAARRLGAEVVFVARLGSDALGAASLAAYRSEGLDVSSVRMDDTAPTGVALILVDREGQNMISVASGANMRLAPDDVSAASAGWAGAQVLVTQLELPLATVRAALRMGRAAGLTTILNPAPARPVPDDLLGLADWLTPNEVEAAILTGVSVTDAESALVAAQALRARGGNNVVVTLGSQGAVALLDGVPKRVPAIRVTSIDATAAGDAFTAGLAVSLARGDSPERALSYATAAGALTTTRAGAQPALPLRRDVEALLGGLSDG